jgi:hypothetical protein
VVEGVEMRAVRLVAGFALVWSLAGCGASEQAAATKTVMPKVEGKQLDVALSDIKRAGFEDEVEVVGGGTFGVVDESNWTVCEQTPAAGKAIKDAPRVVVDRSCPDDSTASTKPTNSETTTAPPTTAPVTTTTSKPKPALPAVLTSENNPGLAALLAEPNSCSDKMRNFAFQYAGKTIEFDGSIDDVAPSGDYETRFNFLVTAGDFDPNKQVGPTFQFRDKNASNDLHWTGPNVPDTVTAGLNIHIKATVGEYDPDLCLFQLTPVSTQVR